MANVLATLREQISFLGKFLGKCGKFATVPIWEERDALCVTAMPLYPLFNALMTCLLGGAKHVPAITWNLASDQIPHLDHPIVFIILAAWYTLGTCVALFEQLMTPLNLQYTFGHDHIIEEPGYWSSGTLKLLKQPRESYFFSIA